MGYTTFTCEDCGKSYVADYTDAKGHNYEEKITTSTCTGIVYTTFTCKDCGISYIGNEQAKTAHDYETTVTALPVQNWAIQHTPVKTAAKHIERRGIGKRTQDVRLDY